MSFHHSTQTRNLKTPEEKITCGNQGIFNVPRELLLDVMFKIFAILVAVSLANTEEVGIRSGGQDVDVGLFISTNLRIIRNE